MVHIYWYTPVQFLHRNAKGTERLMTRNCLMTHQTSNIPTLNTCCWQITTTAERHRRLGNQQHDASIWHAAVMLCSQPDSVFVSQVVAVNDPCQICHLAYIVFDRPSNCQGYTLWKRVLKVCEGAQGVQGVLERWVVLGLICLHKKLIVWKVHSRWSSRVYHLQMGLTCCSSCL